MGDHSSPLRSVSDAVPRPGNVAFGGELQQTERSFHPLENASDSHLAYGLHLNSHTVKEFLMSKTLSHPFMVVPQMLLF
jgi:hypothetical protein